MSWLNHTVANLLPWVPKPLVRPFAMRYVAGETLDDMVSTVKGLNLTGACCTVDVLGEFITDIGQARQCAAEYHQVLARIAENQLDANISIKLTAMGLLLEPAVCEAIVREILDDAKVRQLFVRIDMEDSPCTDATIALYLKLRESYNNVGIVLQAYMRRTMADTRRIIDAGAGHFRLCKGIYNESHTIAYKDPDIINNNYVWVLEDMFARGAYVGIATHDEKLLWHALRLIDQYKLQRHQYEFQMLLGVQEPLRKILLQAGHKVRVYVPYGQQWHGYSMRRFKENPAIVGHVMGSVFKR